MQQFIDIQSTETLTNSRAEIVNNDRTILSCSSGSSFPTTNIEQGMLCLRTDLNQLFQLKDLAPTWVMIFDLNRTAVNKEYVDQQDATQVNTSNVVSVATANKILLLDANGKLPSDITGHASTATNADYATNATNASNADTLGNRHAVDFAWCGNFLNSSDLNNLITPGIWNCQDTVGNKPEANWGACHVSYISNTMWIQQLWIGQYANIYMRYSSDAGSGVRSWSAWRSLAFADSVNQVAVLTGTVVHGGTIPLPTGYTEAQCKWLISVDNRQVDDDDTIQCYTSAVVRDRSNVGRVATNWTDQRGGRTSNYIIIGVK